MPLSTRKFSLSGFAASRLALLLQQTTALGIQRGQWSILDHSLHDRAYGRKYCSEE
ncbi:hypothetical protein CCHOA_06800 [Corynebacterium choanae]|uniref:Uncharacterized protein n=1 Tax=Corynebacterium choanae TaxID=1862358 RepID=A0A3G6J7F5_9CORY|nr:hypothetical protein CCHOA_06800 [Corynebacterium choanae]